jgi:hypothetical protein
MDVMYNTNVYPEIYLSDIKSSHNSFTPSNSDCSSIIYHSPSPSSAPGCNCHISFFPPDVEDNNEIVEKSNTNENDNSTSCFSRLKMCFKRKVHKNNF